MTANIPAEIASVVTGLRARAQRELRYATSVHSNTGEPVEFVTGAEDGSLTRRFVSHIAADECTHIADFIESVLAVHGINDLRNALVDRILQFAPRGGEDPFRAVANRTRAEIVGDVYRRLS